MRSRLSFATVIFLLGVHTLPAMADEIDDQLAIVEKVGAGGTGSEQARVASARLSRQGLEILPRLLDAMDTKNVVAANWLRSVYETLVNPELERTPAQLPAELLKNFVRDRSRQGRVRRLVLATLDRISPEFRNAFLVKSFDDPEFRDDAVNLELSRGDEAKRRGAVADAIKAYDRAFRHARNSSQITTAADRLAEVGEKVSVVEQMGFVTDWYLLGPFAAPGKTGFNLHFPPEEKVDFQAEYDGQNSSRIRWQRYQTPDRMGMVNLVQVIAPVGEAVGYAYAELNASEARDVQIRCGADDNLTIWLNGEKVFSRLQWLNGTRLDRFTAPVRLKAGTNRLLVKVCQGPQHKNPAVPNNWSMQLRFCTPDGAGAGLTSALPSRASGITGE